MEDKIKNAIEEYQCPGCVCGSDTECFQSADFGVGCGKHVVGTMIMPHIGSIFLGMPKGFNRLGPRHEKNQMTLQIFNDFNENEYNFLNIPTWKYKDKLGNTIIRGHRPRINDTFLHVILEDCKDRIDCFEITEKELDGMD